MSLRSVNYCIDNNAAFMVNHPFNSSAVINNGCGHCVQSLTFTVNHLNLDFNKWVFRIWLVAGFIFAVIILFESQAKEQSSIACHHCKFIITVVTSGLSHKLAEMRLVNALSR